MRPQTAKRLLDARNASLEILDFTWDKSIEDMWADRSLQLSLHKLLEIVGEALNQASRFDPDTASAISNLRRFVDLRNQTTLWLRGCRLPVAMGHPPRRYPTAPGTDPIRDGGTARRIERASHGDSSLRSE